MILSINQPAYLPWLGYFDRIAKSDVHVVLDHVQFEKNSFINRNKIVASSKPLWLTIPVLTKGKFGDLPINKVEIDGRLQWQKKHLQSLQHAYSKAIYWCDCADFIKTYYQINSMKLIDHLIPFLKFSLDYLNIKTSIEYSSNYDFKTSKSDLILEICQFFGAKKYLSGPFGRSYLNESKFKENNIEIMYHDYKHPSYKQCSQEFIPNLSILDLILNCGHGSFGVLTNV